MREQNKTAHEVEAQGLTDEEIQYLKRLADDQFSAVVKGIVVPEGLDDQKVHNF